MYKNFLTEKNAKFFKKEKLTSVVIEQLLEKNTWDYVIINCTHNQYHVSSFIVYINSNKRTPLKKK